MNSFSFGGNHVAAALLKFHTRKKRPLLALSNGKAVYSGYRLLRVGFRPCLAWHSVSGSMAEWKRQGTMTRPCRIITEKRIAKISFFAKLGKEPKIRFVWFRDGKGLPTDEIPITAVAFLK